MARDRKEDFKMFQTRKVPWDEDLLNYLYKLRFHFLVARVTGLHIFPHQLFQLKVSTPDKVWSFVMSVASFAMSVEALLFLNVPSIVPDSYTPLKNSVDENIAKYMKPVLSVAMLILRYRISTSFNDPTYLAKVRQVAFDIIHDPVLNELRVELWKVRVLISVVGIMMFSTFFVNLLTWMSSDPRAWKLPWFYIFILEAQMNLTVYLHSAFYIILIGFLVVLPLLLRTVHEFEEAARTISVAKLETAIRCHEVCCSLIEAVDRIASYFLASMLIVAVPQSAITISGLGRTAESASSSRQAIMYLIGNAIVVASFLHLSSAVNETAHRPHKILTARVCGNGDFDTTSSRFTRRFQSDSFGFTFFGIFVFRKRTILSVLNLVTTYLIVAMQMKIS